MKDAIAYHLTSIHTIIAEQPKQSSLALLWYYHTLNQVTPNAAHQLYATDHLNNIVDKLVFKELTAFDYRALILLAHPSLTKQISSQTIDTLDALLLKRTKALLSILDWKSLYRAVAIGYCLSHRPVFYRDWELALIKTYQAHATNLFHQYARKGSSFLLGMEGLTGLLLTLVYIVTITGSDRLTPLIRKGVYFLLSFRREVDFSSGIYSVFPRMASLPEQPPHESGYLGWNGSDLGQALLFYRAAHLLQDDQWRKTADLIGLNTLLRQEEALEVSESINFYQGTAGIAQYYQALHRVSQRSAYQRGYKFWIDHMLHQLSRSERLAYTSDDFLQGWIGIATTLLSHQARRRLDWEQIVLL